MEIGQIRGSAFCHRHGHGHVRRNFGISLSTTPTLFSTKSENRMFILGMGFVGQTLARNLQNQGWLDTLYILLFGFIILQNSYSSYWIHDFF